MRKLFAAAALVLALAGCTTHDNRVDALGDKIVTELEKRPEVSDASYVYKSGLDQGEHLIVKATVKQGEDSAAKDLAEFVIKETWLAPSALHDVKAEIMNSAGTSIATDKLPLPFSPAAKAANKDRYAELESKYGPRPEK
ncbi:hypothetical protein [Alloactinosynnema sp. L-07]|uniref:hypothetical protein n=1 Tax=Alloactinosynnema sp. L-07 TaxID=1653480 RepID=UPI00065EF7F4|nr:hypothetical protein [Alloactinosynnema sp. L-07]CRK60444.1 hypothetical protein [Alloactinosynnema sp. L-07]